jgi:hypothetical protein
LPAFRWFSISPTWSLNSLCTTSSTTSPYRSHHDLQQQANPLSTHFSFIPAGLDVMSLPCLCFWK